MGQKLPVFVYRLVAGDTLEKGIYQACIEKHKVALSLRWGNHEGGKHKEVESYTRQDLYLLINQGEDVSLKPATCGDPVLADVALQLTASAPTILDHDAQFEHAKDDGDAPQASNAAWELEMHTNDNIYNNLSCCSARRMIRQDGSVQLLAHDRHTLDDGTLCAPHPPVFFMRETDKDKKEMSSYTPTVCFSKKQQVFIKFEPVPNKDPASAFADTDKIETRLQYCCQQRDGSDDDDTKLDDTKLYEWQDFPTIFDLRQQKDPKCPLFEVLKSERPKAGHHYLFRIFLHDKSTGVTSPPSRRSATISLMEDEEE